MDIILQYKGLLIALCLSTIYLLSKLFVGKKEHKKVLINVDTFIGFELISKKVLTIGQNPVKEYRFKIEDDGVLGLPIGQHISLKATIDGVEERRSYTPTLTGFGFFDLVLKIYPLGKMTNHVDKLKIGEKIDVSGPKGKFEYKKNMLKEIGMIAGGTGITPMLQIVKEIFEDSTGDNTKVFLIFGNITENDIILKDKIDDYVKKYLNFKCYHCLEKPIEAEKWKQGKGYITTDMIKEHCPKRSDDSKILLCGPPPMIKAMNSNLEKLGFTKDNIFTF